MLRSSAWFCAGLFLASASGCAGGASDGGSDDARTGGAGSSPSASGGEATGGGQSGSGGTDSEETGSGGLGTGAVLGSGGGGEGGASMSGAMGPNPAFDPDVVLSLSNRSFGTPQITSWRRSQGAFLSGEAECSLQAEEGGCVLLACLRSQSSPFLDIGDVSARYETDGSTFETDHTPNPTDPVTSSNFAPTGGTLYGGELLTLSLSGADVPQAQMMLTFPRRLITTNAGGTMEAPGYALPLPREEGITLNWENGAAGVLYQVAGSHSAGDGEYELRCEWESTLGQGTISPNLLTHFTPGETIGTVTVSAWRGTVGDYKASFATGAETIVEEEGVGVFLLVK